MAMKLKTRIIELEKRINSDFPLGQLQGKVSESDFNFVRDNIDTPFMFYDPQNKFATRKREILERAGLIPPIKFAE